MTSPVYGEGNYSTNGQTQSCVFCRASTFVKVPKACIDGGFEQEGLSVFSLKTPNPVISLVRDI